MKPKNIQKFFFYTKFNNFYSKNNLNIIKQNNINLEKKMSS